MLADHRGSYTNRRQNRQQRANKPLLGLASCHHGEPLTGGSKYHRPTRKKTPNTASLTQPKPSALDGQEPAIAQLSHAARAAHALRDERGPTSTRQFLKPGADAREELEPRSHHYPRCVVPMEEQSRPSELATEPDTKTKEQFQPA